MHPSTTKTAKKPYSSLPITINPHKEDAATTFVQILNSLLDELQDYYTQLFILCIGSDRSTGDSLGPLVGNILQELPLPNTTVLGTLSQPVHALNLPETRNLLADQYKSAAILAIDACLGQKSKVGCVEIGKGGIYPGAAVKKPIPPIGDLFITGIVNVGGFMEALVLQNTRLGIVFPLAQFIGLGIFKAISTTEWLTGKN